MFKFDKIEIQRVAVAAVGALFLTTVFIGGTVAPAATSDIYPLVPAAAATEMSDLANA